MSICFTINNSFCKQVVDIPYKNSDMKFYPDLLERRKVVIALASLLILLEFPTYLPLRPGVPFPFLPFGPCSLSSSVLLQ